MNNAIHLRLVFLAFFFVLFGFVVLAQHLAVGIHFDASLLAVLLDDGFKVGALFFPTNNCSTLCLGLGSLLHRGRDVRTIRSEERRVGKVVDGWWMWSY